MKHIALKPKHSADCSTAWKEKQWPANGQWAQGNPEFQFQDKFLVFLTPRCCPKYSGKGQAKSGLLPLGKRLFCAGKINQISQALRLQQEAAAGKIHTQDDMLTLVAQDFEAPKLWAKLKNGRCGSNRKAWPLRKSKWMSSSVRGWIYWKIDAYKKCICLRVFGPIIQLMEQNQTWVWHQRCVCITQRGLTSGLICSWFCRNLCFIISWDLHFGEAFLAHNLSLKSQSSVSRRGFLCLQCRDLS